MTNPTSTAAVFNLLVSKLDVDAGSHLVPTVAAAERKFAQLSIASSVDQGAVYDATGRPIKFLGRR
jgi:hypothetical protein